MSSKRMRGIAVHRSILIGSTATPLTPAERMVAPPDHTHKWTVAVRSAASHPLPSTISTSGAASGPLGEDGVSTRGRDTETDYHKMVGGKDDISHFIKKVQFKLHETYPQATRTIDKPPFQVTETGWGEFDIGIRLFFVPESGEKVIGTHHHLKLHPWHPVHRPVIAAPPPPVEDEAGEGAAAAEAAPMDADASMEAAEGEAQKETTTPAEASGSAAPEAAEAPPPPPAPEAAMTAAPIQQGPPPVLPPVVHSWAYEEIVFPEPTEAFYDVLIAHPPTPLAPTSAQAFSDPTAYRNYKAALAQLPSDTSLGVGTAPAQAAASIAAGVIPPHPLHDPSGALFDALSQEAVNAESYRLDEARINAVRELEEYRTRLIEGERQLREGKKKLTDAGVA